MVSMIGPQPRRKVLPIEIAGSSKFGRYPKISVEKTYNMFLSDNWLVPTPGHLKIDSVDTLSEGRGIFSSSRGNFMLAVIGNGIWRIGNQIQKYGRTIPVNDETETVGVKVGNIDTFSGDVFIDENNAEEIGICDKKDIYIYNYKNNTLQKATLDFIPGFLAFHNGYFLAPDSEHAQWRLSEVNNGLSWPASASYVGEFETKADNPRAAIPVPGKGNFILVMGTNVTESWNDTGAELFPYTKTTAFNIDYGCLNQATIAKGDKFVIWLAVNEKSKPVIMVSKGGPATQISTDGIDFALASLEHPEDAYGFLWKSDGHLFYHLTFVSDKVTYLYDFNTGKFFFLSNEKMENHIAKKVTFFANDYYFISLIDGDIYRISGDTTTYNGKIIPRVRVTNTLRLVNGSSFISNKMGFTLEQGESKELSRVDMSLSYNGGVSFGNIVGHELNPLGKRQNKFTHYQLGRMNEITFQFRFWGSGRFVCANGYLEYYQ